jgi:hypothetical protein
MPADCPTCEDTGRVYPFPFLGTGPTIACPECVPDDGPCPDCAPVVGDGHDA